VVDIGRFPLRTVGRNLVISGLPVNGNPKRGRAILDVSTGNALPEGGPLAPSHTGHPVLEDPVTNLPNRLHFDVVYGVVFAAGTRGFPITVMLIEVPALEASTELLREFAQRVSSVTRRMDLLAHLDDGQFVALLLGCNVHGGRVAAERLLLTLEPWLEENRVEMKIGVAALQPHMKREDELMEEARTALRAARSSPGSDIETRP
jgi:GGDEF domain-containing protein